MNIMDKVSPKQTMTINYFAAFNLRRHLKGDKALLYCLLLITELSAQSFCRDFKGLISTWIKLPAFDSGYCLSDAALVEISL